MHIADQKNRLKIIRRPEREAGNVLRRVRPRPVGPSHRKRRNGIPWERHAPLRRHSSSRPTSITPIQVGLKRNKHENEESNVREEEEYGCVEQENHRNSG